MTQLLSSLALVLSIAATKVDEPTPDMMAEMMKPPKEMGQVSWLLGKWDGDMEFSFGGPPTKGTGTIEFKMTMKGRYMEGTHTYTEKTIGYQEGASLMTFDPEKKKWRAHWFDSTTAEIMEVKGDLTGNKISLESGPMDQPMMGGAFRYRNSYEKSGKGFVMMLDMVQTKDGKDVGAWVNIIKGTFTKAK